MTTRHAVYPTRQATIWGGAVTNTYFNVQKRHPDCNRLPPFFPSSLLSLFPSFLLPFFPSLLAFFISLFAPSPVLAWGGGRVVLVMMLAGACERGYWRLGVRTHTHLLGRGGRVVNHEEASGQGHENGACGGAGPLTAAPLTRTHGCTTDSYTLAGHW